MLIQKVGGKVENPNNMLDCTKAQIGMTAKEVIATFGKPDVEDFGTKKYTTPSIWRYGDVEFIFEPWENGRLVRVQKYNGDMLVGI